ncbi:MAG: hypothetical protein ACI845_000683 [Gammaproteobacteria bacterium]|jgi:hypothetical protein
MFYPSAYTLIFTPKSRLKQQKPSENTIIQVF